MAGIHARHDGYSSRFIGTASAVFCPPSTTIVAPETHFESLLARNSAIAAISSGAPAFGIGCALAYAASASGTALRDAGVAIRPGEIQLTRMKSLPTMRATDAVRLMTP